MLSIVFKVLLLVLHPFYVSITSVDYNSEAQRVEISSRIFYDDLEAALKAEAGLQVDLINPSDVEKTDSLLSRYFRDRFRVSVDGQPLTLKYLGYEIEDDVAWCYLEAGNITAINRLAVDSRILFDQFPKQSNILHVTAYGKRKSRKLDNPQRRAVFEW